MDQTGTDAAAPGGPVGSVEGLASVSDAVFSGTVVREVQVDDSVHLARVLEVKIDDQYRGEVDATAQILVLEDQWPGLDVGSYAIVFTRLLSAADLAVGPLDPTEWGKNPLYVFSPSPNAVLALDGRTVKAVVGFDSLELATNSTPREESSPLITAIDEARFADIVGSATVALPEPGPVVPTSDSEWLALLDEACAGAQPAISDLVAELRATGDRRQFDATASLDLLETLRSRDADLDSALSSSGASDDLVQRWADAKLVLDDVALLLKNANGLSGDQLSKALDSIALRLNDFQLVWVGVDVANCKQFV